MFKDIKAAERRKKANKVCLWPRPGPTFFPVLLPRLTPWATFFRHSLAGSLDLWQSPFSHPH